MVAPPTPKPPVVTQPTPKPPVVTQPTPKPPVVTQPTPKPPVVAPPTPKPPVVTQPTPKPPVVTQPTPKPPVVSRPKPPVVVNPPPIQQTPPAASNPKPPVVSTPKPPVVSTPKPPITATPKPPVVRDPLPPVRDDRFERPLPPSRPPSGGLVAGIGDDDRARVRHADDDARRPHRRDRFSIFVGAGFGFGLHVGNLHVWRGSPFCYYDPFFYDPFCRPVAYYGDCRWSSGFTWYSSWYCWPRASYWPRHWGHHRVRWVTYVRPRCDWLTEFRFCSVPTYTVAHCGLISPRVVYCEPAPTTVVYTEPSTIVYASASPPPAVVTIPAPASPGDLMGTSDRELGDTYLRLGDSPSAIRVYRQHLAAYPGDVQAVRSLGLSLIDIGEVLDGAAQVELAYRIDPALVARPLNLDSLPTRDALDRALDAATRAANRADSASTWLAVAVIMQASDRRAPALVALERARAAGLDAAIADAFAGVLGS
ncbi:MAG: hypothetical protein JNM80_13200 [Phycisphaerae bacterium]|nr:hypothetical protein [Phycisphaerae bacterium]